MMPQLLLVIAAAAATSASAAPPLPPLDTLAFGKASSASAHSMELRNARVVRYNETAALGEPSAVHIADQKPGGAVLFVMAVDPRRRNHLTIKFWGGALADVP